MKDPTTFDTVGDEPIEARIVAWVLGEASAFEAAELERLCEERPELLVFRRRMTALHGLLTEAESAQPDKAWKLTPAKRSVLDEICGVENVVRLEAQKERCIRRAGFRAVLAIAACLVVAVIVLQLIHPIWRHQIIRESEKKVDFMPASGGEGEEANEGLSFASGGGANSGEVARKDSLPASRGMIVAKEKDTKNRLVLPQVPNAKQLDQTIRDQEDNAEESRKVLGTLARTKGIIHKGLDAQDYAGAKRDFESEQQKLVELKRQRGEIASASKAEAESVAQDESIHNNGGRLGRNLISPVHGTTVDGVPAEPSETTRSAITAGNRSGDQAVSRNDIDAILNNTNRGSESSSGDVTNGIRSFTGVWSTSPSAPAPASTPAPVAQKAPAEQTSGAYPLIKSGAGSLNLQAAAKDAARQGQLAAATARRLAEAKPLGLESNDALPDPAPPTDGPLLGDIPVVGRLFSDRLEGGRVGGMSGASGNLGTIDESAGGPASELSTTENKKHAVARARSVPQNGKPQSMAAIARVEENPYKIEDGKQSRDADKGFSNLEEFSKTSRPSMEKEIAFGDGDKAKESTKSLPTSPPVLLSKAKQEIERLADKKSGDVSGNLDINGITLSGANTYTGGTVTSAGALALGAGALNTETGVTHGLRSGDQAITHNSIDAVLNNPNRVASSVSDANKKISPVDTKSDAFAPTEPKGGENEEFKESVNYGAPIVGFSKPEEKEATVDPFAPAGISAADTLLARRDSFQNSKSDIDGEVDFYSQGARDNHSELDKRFQLSLRAGSEKKVESAEVPLAPKYDTLFSDPEKEKENSPGYIYNWNVGATNRDFKFLTEYEPPTIDKYRNTSPAVKPGDKDSKENIEYEIHSDNKSEYLFRGVDLSKDAESAPALVDLMEELSASETPYSTFSLNINDASFQLAKAALAKGERPEPASIKTEQFYNAVDYGDPAPTAGEPVSGVVEQSAHPVIPGRSLVRVALRTGSAGRSVAQPLRLTLLVDQSGSMVREDRRASMEHALSQLSVLLTKNDLVTVIGFSRTPHLLAENVTGDQAGKLSDLINQTASEGGTNLEEAMKVGGQKALAHQLTGAQNRIVLFTDGAANLGDANPERLAEQVKAFRQKGLAFDIAGIGADGLNDRLLSELARNGNGRYYVVGQEKNDSFSRQLAGAFRPAAENVKVQVNFNPQRVGKYKLIGFEKDRLKTEDFRNDAVDAAELAADEAGVAIYQVQPLAEGTGELGEVSVRFRDAASKEMVERTWTIPYDANAPAFDRATPSMQLAGLSLLAAEKLRGGPFADAIDFKQLTAPQAMVKQFYGGSTRVGDMLRVIDALRH